MLRMFIELKFHLVRVSRNGCCCWSPAVTSKLYICINNSGDEMHLGNLTLVFKITVTATDNCYPESDVSKLSCQRAT